MSGKLNLTTFARWLWLGRPVGFWDSPEHTTKPSSNPFMVKPASPEKRGLLPELLIFNFCLQCNISPENSWPTYCFLCADWSA
jgi:hypothetical protein